MKKSFISSAIITLSLMVSINANAQIDLGSIAKSVVNSATSGSKTAITDAIGSVINSKNAATATDIVGTWIYSRPAVVFESNNLLKQAGGSIASNTIENKISTQLKRVGITSGKFNITFAKDGTFTTNSGTKKNSGTYKIANNKITLSYLQGLGAISGYAQMSGSDLQLIFDSSKLLKFVSAASKFSANSTLKTISSLAGSYNGMKSGMEFKKTK